MDSSRVAAIRFFADLPEADLDAVASVAFDVEVPAGQELATEQGLGHALFAVESGTADIVIRGKTVRTIGPGDVVGEIAVLASPPDPQAAPEIPVGGQRTASVVATSTMRLLGLFRRDVWALDRQAPVAAQRLREAMERHRAADEERALDEQRGSAGADATSAD
jgi:CRP-like cAMP-binding protein